MPERMVSTTMCSGWLILLTLKVLDEAKIQITDYLPNSVARDDPGLQDLPSGVVYDGPDRHPNLVQLIVAVTRPTLMNSNGVFSDTENLLSCRLPKGKRIGIMLLHDFPNNVPGRSIAVSSVHMHEELYTDRGRITLS